MLPRYYNEPGNEKHAGTVEGEQQARLYNENARLLALQATTAAARRPPKPFRTVVVEHFTRDGAALIADLERAAADAPPSPPGASPTAPVAGAYSGGFKRVLRRLAPLLRKAVEGLGVSLSSG